MSKLKLCLFRIFLAVWKFQIRDRGRGGYCGSSWISLSSVHFCTHSLQLLQRYSKILPDSTQSKPTEFVNTELVNIAALQQNQEGTPQWIILSQQRIANCTTVKENFAIRQKCCACCACAFQCKLHWVALNRISEQCSKQEAAFGGGWFE